MREVEFLPAGIRFPRYRYPGASVYPSGVVEYSAIREVDPACAPPEIRLRSGEILFVPATQREALARVASNQAIPTVQRVDIWDLIFEPFLDTEFSPAHKERTFAELERCGISRRQVRFLRWRFGPRMFLYNAILWDWVHLGLADLLMTYPSRLWPSWLPLAHWPFKRVYRLCMAIAQLGRIRGDSSNPTEGGYS